MSHPAIRFSFNAFLSRIATLASAMALAIVMIGADHSAYAADDKKASANTISKKVAPPLKAAFDAYNAKQFDVAFTKLQEADAVPGKTPYEQFRIDELKALIFVNQGKFAEPLAIYEKHQGPDLEGFVEPQLKEIRLKVMTQLAFRSQAYDKALVYGKQWMAAHPDDTATLDLMARASYIGKDYKSALELVKTAIGNAEANGKAPEEVWLQLYSSCSSNLDDTAGVMAGYEKLVRYYPKPEHWGKALETLLVYDKKNDAAVLDIFRLMLNTGVMKQPDHYMEMAQRATDRALPGEALKVLDEGFEKKILGASEKDKDRQVQAQKTARDKAKADKAQLPEVEKEVNASKAKTGQLEAGLGLGYYSHQMYEPAVKWLEAGLNKGGLRNTEDYRMALGMSYLQLGQKEKARDEFKKVTGNATYTNVANFWIARTYN